MDDLGNVAGLADVDIQDLANTLPAGGVASPLRLGCLVVRGCPNPHACAQRPKKVS